MERDTVRDNPHIAGALQVVLPMSDPHPESEKSRTEAFCDLVPFACILFFAPPCGVLYSFIHFFYVGVLTERKVQSNEKAANLVMNVFFLISWIPYFNLIYGIQVMKISFSDRNVGFVDAVGPIATYYFFCLWILVVAYRLYRTGLSFEETKSQEHIRTLSEEEQRMFFKARPDDNDGLFTWNRTFLTLLMSAVVVASLRFFQLHDGQDLCLGQCECVHVDGVLGVHVVGVPRGYFGRRRSILPPDGVLQALPLLHLQLPQRGEVPAGPPARPLRLLPPRFPVVEQRTHRPREGARGAVVGAERHIHAHELHVLGGAGVLQSVPCRRTGHLPPRRAADCVRLRRDDVDQPHLLHRTRHRDDAHLPLPDEEPRDRREPLLALVPHDGCCRPVQAGAVEARRPYAVPASGQRDVRPAGGLLRQRR
eukprot:PhM_4_TR1999/c0_g1_i1/m.17223